MIKKIILWMKNSIKLNVIQDWISFYCLKFKKLITRYNNYLARKFRNKRNCLFTTYNLWRKRHLKDIYISKTLMRTLIIGITSIIHKICLILSIILPISLISLYSFILTVLRHLIVLRNKAIYSIPFRCSNKNRSKIGQRWSMKM